MKYRLAAFDFDGTLADSFGWFVRVMPRVAEKYRFRRVEAEDAERLRAMTGRQLLAHLRLPAWKLPLVAAHVRRLQAQEIGQIRLFDGIPEMLRDLDIAGMTVAIVSSNAESNVRRVLGEELSLIVRHYGCGASLLGKRHKLKSILRRIRVQPADAIYIGDEIRDIEAAKMVGMASAAVSWGCATPDALIAAGPTMTFRNPASIVQKICDG
jgi:phosphoglycolate phosphatase